MVVLTGKSQRRPDAGWCLLDAAAENGFPPRVRMTATKRAEMRSINIIRWTCYTVPGRYEHEQFLGRLPDGRDGFFLRGVHAGSMSEMGFVTLHWGGQHSYREYNILVGVQDSATGRGTCGVNEASVICKDRR